MYSVFSIRKGNDKYYVSCQKRTATKEEAIAFKMARMAGAHRQCGYVVIADRNREKFFANVEKASAPLQAQARAREEREARRWKEMDAMYIKGYKVHDALAYSKL